MGLFLFLEDFRADKSEKCDIYNLMSESVITCVKAGQFGFIIHGWKVAVENGRAHLVYPFRDDTVEVDVPESEVQTPDMCCETCKYRLQHMITNGECPGKYAPVAQWQSRSL